MRPLKRSITFHSTWHSSVDPQALLSWEKQSSNETSAIKLGQVGGCVKSVIN